MGMGEPFHNYDNTLAAIDRLNHPEGMNLGARRFTISTVGIVPMIRRFAAEERQVNLAISLHAADDDPTFFPSAGQPKVSDRRFDRRLPRIRDENGTAHHLRVGFDQRCQRHARTGAETG